MSKKYRLGFLRFEETGSGITLVRAGTFCGKTADSLTPKEDGFCTVLTDQRNYLGGELQYQGTEVCGNSLTFRFKAADHSFSVESCWSLDEESGIVSRKDRFVNTGSNPCMLRRFFGKIVLQCSDYELYSQQSRWGMESAGLWQPLHIGTLELNSRLGRWTEGGSPFAALRTEESQDALAFHLIPNGDYIMRFSASVFSTHKPSMLFTYGISDENLNVKILPDEFYETPEILIQNLPNREAWSGSTMLHRFANKRCPAWKPLPVLYNTWLDRMSDLDPARLCRELAAAKAAGCEVFIIDAGWYRNNGDWREKTDSAFCGKMKEFADQTRTAGLAFGLWIEPEFFIPNVPALTEHPEFFLSIDERNPQASSRVNFEVPGAVDFYYEMIAGVIRKYQLGYVKFDMNRSLGPDPTRQELRTYLNGVHDVMLRLRKEFPETILENCSSGAMRTTLAELPYFDQHFISDNANVLDVLHISQGTMLKMPAGRLMRWLVLASSGSFRPWEYTSEEIVTQPQNATWKHYEETDLNCGLLACMLGVLGFSGDLDSLREDTLAKIRQYTDFYKTRRKLLQCGETTLLSAPHSIDHRHGIMTFLVSDPKTDRHLLFLFYRNCDGYLRTVWKLPAKAPCSAGVDPLKQYKAVPLFGNQPEAETMCAFGAQLISDGLEIPLELEQHGDFKGLLWEIEPL